MGAGSAAPGPSKCVPGPWQLTSTTLRVEVHRIILHGLITGPVPDARAALGSPLIRDELRQLAAELNRVRLALAVAPGGSGKTTLLRSWQRDVTSSGSATAWLNLTAVHADATLQTSTGNCIFASGPGFAASIHDSRSCCGPRRKPGMV